MFKAHHSNKFLVSLIKKTLQQHHIDEHPIYLLPPEHEATHILLTATGLVDVCIPRGSQALIDFVRENAKIPVIETGAGIVHTYFDASGDHVDAAAVYVNASTAFTDGGQFGMGAEIGISTQKLHARGPMALDALTSYKWVILGDGQIRV